MRTFYARDEGFAARERDELQKETKTGVRPDGRTPDTLSNSEQTDDYALFGPDRVKLITASWPSAPVAV